MRILLTGRNGQVGWELERRLPALGEVIATDRAALDLADPDAIRRVLREAKPDAIVNAAAYTAVDKAEAEPHLAMRVNGEAPGVLAEEAKRLGALLVHYSTDYLFDGAKREPYTEDDAPNPLNVYGASKLAGERAIAALGGRYLIFRTSWVYGARGSNFFLTMLKLLASRPELRVVDDQSGAPTWCREIAAATVEALRQVPQRAPSGVYHLSARGATTWHGYASLIAVLMREHGLAVQAALHQIPGSEFASAARRPANSRLSNARLEQVFGIRPDDWQSALRACFHEWRAAARAVQAG